MVITLGSTQILQPGLLGYKNSYLFKARFPKKVSANLISNSHEI
jgi:hypothetical protein